MRWKVRITSKAETQILEVFNWYENVQSGLGRSFEKELLDRLNQIRENPLKFQVRYKVYRLVHLR